MCWCVAESWMLSYVSGSWLGRAGDAGSGGETQTDAILVVLHLRPPSA